MNPTTFPPILVLLFGIIIGLLIFYAWISYNFNSRPAWVLKKLAKGAADAKRVQVFVDETEAKLDALKTLRS